MMIFSAHLGYLFTQLPLRQRFAAAAAAGFCGVEHPNPYSISSSDLRNLLATHDLSFLQFAFPSGDPARSEKGFAALPGRNDEFKASIDAGLSYAVEAGISFIQLQSGLIPEGIDPDVLWQTYISNLCYAADRAKTCGIDILIEPIGPATVAGYFMNRAALALRALDEAGKSNVLLLIDVFHATDEGLDIGSFIQKNANRIGHLHIADHPGRHEPGSGDIDFAVLFHQIKTSGYSGVIGCEYKPLGNTKDGLSWFEPFARSV